VPGSRIDALRYLGKGKEREVFKTQGKNSKGEKKRQGTFFKVFNVFNVFKVLVLEVLEDGQRVEYWVIDLLSIVEDLRVSVHVRVRVISGNGGRDGGSFTRGIIQ